jgi:hypothetical protein
MYINYNDFTYKSYKQIIKKIKENFKIIFHNDLFYNSDFYLNDKANRYIIRGKSPLNWSLIQNKKRFY